MPENPYKDCETTKAVLERFQANMLDPGSIISMILGTDVWTEQIDLAALRIGEIWGKAFEETGYQKPVKLPNCFMSYERVEDILLYLSEHPGRLSGRIINDAHERIKELLGCV